MRKVENIRQWVAGLMLVLFSFYYANVCLFTHTHIINGTTIVHSHIHSAAHHDTPSGQHTASSLELIAALNEFNSLEEVPQLIDFSLKEVQTAEHFALYAAEVHDMACAGVSLRAPPVA